MIKAAFSQFRHLDSKSDILLAIFVILILMLLVIPVYPFVIDLLIALSFTLAVTTLLVTLYAKEPLSFSAFPSLLLFLTLYRLGLNIATTRMILNDGYAGKMVQTFGDFVTGGSPIVGFILFLLLTVINFIVITKGSGRVAEVAARFTLDALPGKQMSIDADLNTGVIDKKEALIRRQKLIAESDFYGAMDGASKFVRGDAIAGAIITVVNIIGGLMIGIMVKEMNYHDVINVYMTLAVGDGLITQIPALLISVAAGIIVTRSSSDKNLGILFREQLFGNPKALVTTAIVLIILGFVPGMPTLILFTMAGALLLFGHYLNHIERKPEKKEDVERPNRLSPHFQEEIAIHIGSALDSELLNAVTERVRKESIKYLGISIAPIDLHLDPLISNTEYIFFLKGNEIASYSLYPDHLLIVPLSEEKQKIDGILTIEPISDLPAFWVKKQQKEKFPLSKYRIHEPLEVFIQHLQEFITTHANELLSRREVLRLLEQAKSVSPEIVEEVYPNHLDLATLTKILRSLLNEQIPLAKFTAILEALADNLHTTTDTETLTESVRQSMFRELVLPYTYAGKVLHVITLDPKVDEMLAESVSTTSYGRKIILHPDLFKKLIYQLSNSFEREKKIGRQPVLITSIKLRPHLKNLIEKLIPKLPIFSYEEISPYVTLKQVANISADILSHTSSLQGVL